MKRFDFLNGAALAALVIGAPMAASPFVTAPAQAQSATQTATVRVEQFRETLTPLGEYVQIQGLGEAWKPRNVAPDWQPYSVGRWIFNDRVGWYFQSDEPWAEITFHYGRWYDDPEHGWVWVADTEWAPAWVEWRHSKQHIGWRPLPPENAPRRTGARTTPSRSTVARTRRPGSTEIVEEAWVFVPTERIVAEDIRSVRVERTRVVEIYEETRPIGRAERRGTIAVNFALRPEVIERETRVTVRTQNLPRAATAPVPREVRSIATEPRSTPSTDTTSTSGTGTGTSSTTTGTSAAGTAADQPADAPSAVKPPPSTAETPNQNQPATSTDAPRTGTNRPSASETTSTDPVPINPGRARSTATTPPNAGSDPNRARDRRRQVQEGADTTGTPKAATEARPPATDQSAATPSERRNQRRLQRPGQEDSGESAQSPTKAAPSGQAPTERAQRRRPSDTEATGSAGSAAADQPRRRLPANADVPEPGQGPAPRRAAPGLDQRSQGGTADQPSSAEARQETRGGNAGSAVGNSDEATGSTASRPRRLLRPGQGSEGEAPQQ